MLGMLSTLPDLNAAGRCLSAAGPASLAHEPAHLPDGSSHPEAAAGVCAAVQSSVVVKRRPGQMHHSARHNIRIGMQSSSHNLQSMFAGLL